MLLRDWGSCDEGAASPFYIFNQKYLGAFDWLRHNLIYCSLRQKRSCNEMFLPKKKSNQNFAGVEGPVSLINQRISLELCVCL